MLSKVKLFPNHQIGEGSDFSTNLHRAGWEYVAVNPKSEAFDRGESQQMP